MTGRRLLYAGLVLIDLRENRDADWGDLTSGANYPVSGLGLARCNLDADALPASAVAAGA